MTTFAAIGLLVLASCSKSTDLYQPPVEPEIPTPVTPTEPEITQEDINANVQKVFGTTFDPNHDWCTTVNGKVTILVNSSIKTVQVLVYLEHVDEDGEPYTSMEVLNAAEVDGRSSITLTYDAPKVNNGLFVAFISDTNYQLAKVEGETVSLNNVAKTRGEGDDVEETPYTLPNGTFTIGKSIESYANTRGWVPGEMLYELESYTAQKMTVPNYSEEMKTAFKSMVLSYFQNKQRNLQKVKSSGLYNDKVYPITTGDKPIIVMPAFKWDSGSKYGNEIYNSDLYYYYFDTKGNLKTGFITVNGKKWFASSIKGYMGKGEILSGLVWVNGKYFGNSAGVTAAVVQCLKEQNFDPDQLKVKVCNGAQECKTALTMMKLGRLPESFIEGMICEGGCVGGPARQKAVAELKKDRDAMIGLADKRGVHENLKIMDAEQVHMHRE